MGADPDLLPFDCFLGLFFPSPCSSLGDNVSLVNEFASGHRGQEGGSHAKLGCLLIGSLLSALESGSGVELPEATKHVLGE